MLRVATLSKLIDSRIPIANSLQMHDNDPQISPIRTGPCIITV